MKFLHLSDLHIGKSVNGFSMIAEQKHICRQIIGHIKTEQPAAVIIAGDIYDRAVPSVEALRVFDDFLTELAREDAALLLIAGNHDSPERIQYASRLLSDKQIYFYGLFDGRLQQVTLNDQHGELHFWLLPFVKAASVRTLFGEQEIGSHNGAVRAALAAADIDYNARNVLVSHQFYTKAGAAPLRSESELQPVGGLDAVDTGTIERFDYAALGHLHGRQSAGAEHIRYCGSPVKYSFSERRQEKSITVVEMGGKGDLTLRFLPLTPLHDMREIKGELNRLIDEEYSSLADKDDYLRVILTDEDEIIDPLGKLRSVYPNIMSLDFENTRTSIDISSITSDADSAEGVSAYALFSEFFLETQGVTMSEAQADIVRDLLERSYEE